MFYIDWLKLSNGRTLVVACMNDLLSAEFDLGNGFTIGSNERNWKELSNEYMRVKILNNSSDPTKYFLVTSYKKAGDYWIGVYQNTGP